MKHFFRLILATTTLVASLSLMSVPTFATEVDTINDNVNNAGEAITLELTSEGIVSASASSKGIMPYSSISGYEQQTINSSDHGVIVFTSGSGIGGMGVTIKASSSWNGDMTVHMAGYDGSTPFMNAKVTANGTTYFNNLITTNPAFYLFNFLDIPSGVSVFVQIWVYG